MQGAFALLTLYFAKSIKLESTVLALTGPRRGIVSLSAQLNSFLTQNSTLSSQRTPCVLSSNLAASALPALQPPRSVSQAILSFPYCYTPAFLFKIERRAHCSGNRPSCAEQSSHRQSKWTSEHGLRWKNAPSCLLSHSLLTLVIISLDAKLTGS